MEIEIKDLGINGEGVGRIGDKVCFVDFSLPSEVLDISVCKEKSKFCYARVNKIISKSSDRVEPQCPYFGSCGGCDLQHIKTTYQEKFKKERVKRELGKLTNEDKIEDTVFGDGFGYRNKMAFCVTGNPIKIGMVDRYSFGAIEVEKCMLANEKINRVLALSSTYFASSNYSGFDTKKHIGDIKYLVIRSCGDEILITIVATRMLKLKEYFDYLKASLDDINIGLSIVISDDGKDILGGKYFHLYGCKYLTLDEFGIKYKVNNLGFLQVNDKMKEKLYKRVLDEIDENSSVIDAYSGAGLMSAIVSRRAQSVVGIEINKSASLSAENLAQSNNLTNIRFICDTVESAIDNVLSDLDNITIILDPPRSGCEASVCKKLNDNSHKISKVIYISCNPSTLRRDMEILCEKYRIISLIPFDLFPNTKHIETLAIMERK